MKRLAFFDEDRSHRYALWRTWGQGPECVFIGLNPSLANEEKDDPTIRRCINFAKEWGYGGLIMLNIFAAVTPYPSLLQAMVNPIGELNTRVIVRHCKKADIVVACWGGIAYGRDQADHILAMVLKERGEIHCLGVNKDGTPKHPLYLASSTKPRVWRKRIE